MSRALQLRLALIVAAALALEFACRAGYVTKLTMVPPSTMVVGLFEILRSGEMLPDILATLLGVVIAILASISIGFLAGIVLYGLPRVRRSLDPFLATYYSIPTLVFYPLFIVLLGLNDRPKIAIGFLHAVVIMLTSTLNGLDRVPTVLRRTARVFRLNPVQTTFLVVLPAAAPHIFTGGKLAIAYAFVGVLGAEFVLSNRGLGYEIAYAFNDFDNTKMYSLILLVLLIVAGVNGLLTRWETGFLRRRGRS